MRWKTANRNRRRAKRFDRVQAFVRMLAPSPMPQWMIDELSKPILFTDETMYFDKGPTRKLAPFVSPVVCGPHRGGGRLDASRVPVILSKDYTVTPSALDVMETIQRNFTEEDRVADLRTDELARNIALHIYIKDPTEAHKNRCSRCGKLEWPEFVYGGICDECSEVDKPDDSN